MNPETEAMYRALMPKNGQPRLADIQAFGRPEPHLQTLPYSYIPGPVPRDLIQNLPHTQGPGQPRVQDMMKLLGQ